MGVPSSPVLSNTSYFCPTIPCRLFLGPCATHYFLFPFSFSLFFVTFKERIPISRQARSSSLYGSHATSKQSCKGKPKNRIHITCPLWKLVAAKEKRLSVLTRNQGNLVTQDEEKERKSSAVGLFDFVVVLYIESNLVFTYTRATHVAVADIKERAFFLR